MTTEEKSYPVTTSVTCVGTVYYSIRKSSGCVTWVVEEVSRPSHRLMNWAFIIAVASWSKLERFLRNDSKTHETWSKSKNEKNIYTKLICITG